MRVDLRPPNQEEPISPRIVSKFFDSLKVQIKADLITIPSPKSELFCKKEVSSGDIC